MKIGVMSDPHFHAYKNHSTIIDGINSRLLDVENAWKQAVNELPRSKLRGINLFVLYR
jgi:hypothetical protein